MKYLFLFTGLLALTSYAQAQDTRSEFFYQAAASEMFVEGQISQLNRTHESDVVPEDLDFSDLGISAAFESGLSDMFSVYGKLGYGSGKLESGPMSNKFEGLDPLQFGVKMRKVMGSGELFARAHLGLGFLEERDCDSSEVCNRTDKSTQLSFHLGYLWSFNSSFFGLAADVGIFSTDGKVSDGYEYSYDNGYSITAFYEQLFLDMVFGGALRYSNAGSLLTSSNGAFYLETDETTIINARIYTRIPMAEGFALLGGLSYDLMIDQENETLGLDGGSGFSINIGLRYTL